MEMDTAQPVRVKKLNLFENVQEEDYQVNLRDEWFNSNTPTKHSKFVDQNSDTRPSKRFLGNDFAMTQDKSQCSPFNSTEDVFFEEYIDSKEPPIDKQFSFNPVGQDQTSNQRL